MTGTARRSGLSTAVALVLVAAHGVLVLDGARRHGAVYDETVYPTAGYAYWTTGDYRMNPEHPPLLKLWTGLAWLGEDLPITEAPGWSEGLEWPWSQAVLFGSGRHESLLFRARLMVAILSMVLAWAIHTVARRRGGGAAGLAALALYAFDPLAIAHGGLATTDLGAALTYFLAVLALPSALERGGGGLLVAGLLLGLALSAKFSSLSLVPLALAAASAWSLLRTLEGRVGGPLPGWVSRWRRAAVIVLVAVIVLFATYGPGGVRAFMAGLAFLGGHSEAGHGAYAFGLYSDRGWWWYFPAAWIVKTPIPLLLATGLGVGIALRSFRERAAELALWGGALLFYAIPVIASSINIGVRHMLPVVPFLAVLGGESAARLWRGGRLPRAAVALGALWLMVGTLRAHPNLLGYSNEIFGGPKGTWRYLADSNVDWGQDLPLLARELSKEPLRRLYLGYLGSADPSAYGLRYVTIPSFGYVPRRFEDGPEPGGKEWIAISVTNLLDVFVEGHAAYAWLRQRPMTRLLGTSIALYDITGDAAAHRELARTALAFGETEGGEVALRRLLELAPRDGDARLALARSLAAQGRLDEAVLECTRAREILDPATVDLFCGALGEGGGATPLH